MNQAPIRAAPEIAQWLTDVTAAWRAGDARAVRAAMSADPSVSMGGPSGAVPMAVGRDAVGEMIDRLVQPLPEGAGVFPLQVSAFAAGDLAWANADCELRLPGQPPLGWFIVLVLRREEGNWRALNFGAFAGRPSA